MLNTFDEEAYEDMLKNVHFTLGSISEMIEENNIEDIPSFFIIRLYNGGNGDSSLVEDFGWWIKMKDLYKIQFDLRKYKECLKTIKEMQNRLGYFPCFQSLYDTLISIIKKEPCFMYNGRDNVTWEELPLEVRKHDYPYYFDDHGNDCYPFYME